MWWAVLLLSDVGRRDVVVKIMCGIGVPDEVANWVCFGYLLCFLVYFGFV